MTISLGMGIRSMYEHGYDFVDRTMIKRLSMEYDWKRKPHFVGETPISIDGVNNKKHIFFSTIPWKSLNEYQKVRSVWEEFNHTNRRVLKTKKDYDNWCEFFEGKNVDVDINNPDVGRYLSKVDGPIKRLREQLIVAHKLKKGGCCRVYQKKSIHSNRSNDRLIIGHHLKAEEFAETLTSILGIEVSKSDVVNGRKKQYFKPHSVPNTKNVNLIIRNIKRMLFPDLRVDEFLTKPSQLQLRGCELVDCKISQKMEIIV